ncbi:ThiF family adenylyltransferase [Pontibacter litorisediminis]|uniref:ThiF family adenylyltransferase n=1 Tax=Pontibacter litorisediminis TaxID=1846260 RepID=UPI0023EBF524|nr:ThiF family adenylyltransferase [Pontibacter litorisediminis]
MGLKLEDIKSYILENPLVQKLYSIEQGEFSIYARVKISFAQLKTPLDFEIEILPQYPLKSYESESIIFRNKDLISYSHVMGDGKICVNTLHSTDIRQKLSIDFNALKNWIEKYYIDEDKDLNYEHIIVPDNLFSDSYYSYIFTDTERTFVKGEYGDVKISYLNTGVYKGKTLLNYIVQGFIPLGQQLVRCEWSNIYKGHEITQDGLFIFIGDAPATYNKFVYKNWLDLDEIIPQEFLKQLHQLERKNYKRLNGHVLPLFIGYNTVGNKVHWQVALIKYGEFPLYGKPETNNGVKTGSWLSKLSDTGITWAISRNSSYKYFFGRGALSHNITDKKILIIGVGAIGSIIAKTLTRGGCKYIDFVDYDVKEPENVCRSEYLFLSGITEKTEELKNILSAISPFVNIKQLNNNYFETLFKTFHENREYQVDFIKSINNYDLIFDCSTDNDLMYILDSMNLSAELINISITNHAKELVCAFHPNIYRFVNIQFTNVLDNDVDDLYNPIGCWSPTFKASYNDINVLVQLAIKQINGLFHENKSRSNFVIKFNESKMLDLTVAEF